MTILIYTTLSTTIENQQSLFNILYDMSKSYSGLYAHEEDNKWVITIDNTPYELIVMKNLDSILPSLNAILSKYNSSVSQLKRLAFISRSARSFMEIITEKLGGKEYPLVKLTQPRLQAIDRRYAGYLTNWKKENSPQTKPKKYQQHHNMDDNSSLLPNVSVSVQDHNDQFDYEIKLDWFTTHVNQSAYQEKEKTLIYLFNYVNNTTKQKKSALAGLMPFCDPLMHPHSQSFQISTAVIKDNQAESVKFLIKFIKHNIIELNSFDNIWINIEEFITQLKQSFQNKRIPSLQQQTKINHTDLSFEITLTPLHLDEKDHASFIQDIDTCLFLSSISEIAHLGNVIVALNPKQNLYKLNTSSASLNPPNTSNQFMNSNDNSQSSLSSLSTLKIGSPVTAAGDAYSTLKQRVMLICKSRMSDFKPFVDAINSKNYGKALRTACTSTDDAAFELIKLLFSYKNDLPFEINEQTGVQHLAIHLAAKKGNINLYNFLKDKGANHLLTDKDGITAEKYLNQYLEKNSPSSTSAFK